MAPSAMTAEYYGQRASEGGLLITESVHISPEGTPIFKNGGGAAPGGGEHPGIWSEAQVEGYRRVVLAVHAKGGAISCQLAHCGRLGHAEMRHHPTVVSSGLRVGPVAPSAKAHDAAVWGTPTALTAEGIRRVVADYVHAARNAMAAGFDAVELHAGYGFLVDQFLCDSSNKRTDGYGGSVANRWGAAE